MSRATLFDFACASFDSHFALFAFCTFACDFVLLRGNEMYFCLARIANCDQDALQFATCVDESRACKALFVLSRRAFVFAASVNFEPSSKSRALLSFVSALLAIIQFDATQLQFSSHQNRSAFECSSRHAKLSPATLSQSQLQLPDFASSDLLLIACRLRESRENDLLNSESCKFTYTNIFLLFRRLLQFQVRVSV